MGSQMAYMCVRIQRDFYVLLYLCVYCGVTSVLLLFWWSWSVVVFRLLVFYILGGWGWWGVPVVLLSVTAWVFFFVL